MEKKKERGRGERKTYRMDEVSTWHLYEHDVHCSYSHLFSSYTPLPSPIYLLFFLNNPLLCLCPFYFNLDSSHGRKCTFVLKCGLFCLAPRSPVPPIFLSTTWFSSSLSLSKIPLVRVFFTHPSSDGWFHYSAIVSITAETIALSGTHQMNCSFGDIYFSLPTSRGFALTKSSLCLCFSSSWIRVPWTRQKHQQIKETNVYKVSAAVLFIKAQTRSK